MKRLCEYLIQLERPKIILWCYFWWYAAVVFQYFDPSPSLWMSSLGISFLVGYALNIAAQQKGQTRDRWVVFRLYLFPFCVSSFAAIIKGQGFFLLFPTEPKPLIITCLTCCGFLICTFAIKKRGK